MVHEQVLREIEVFRVAGSIHEAKGFGKITED
jgi:hypothetical protein